MTAFVWILLGLGVLAIAWLLARMALRRKQTPGQLVFLNGPREGEVVQLEANGRLRIGALPDNDIVIPSKEVSREHSELRVRGNHRVHIWDLESLNGTYVNGNAVRTVELSPNDVIRVADVEMRFER